MNHAFTHRALFLACAILTTSALAQAAGQGLQHHSRRAAMLCDTPTSCRAVSTPKEAGVVTRVFKVDFIPGKIGFVAYGPTNASLCYETPAPAVLAASRKTVTFCQPILTHAPYHDLAIKQVDDGEGGKNLEFTASGKLAKYPTSTRHAILDFMAGIERAKASMGKQAAKPKRTADFGMCNATDWDMMPICADGGDTGGDNYPDGGGTGGGGGYSDIDDFAAKSTGCWPIVGGYQCGSKRNTVPVIGGLPDPYEIPPVSHDLTPRDKPGEMPKRASYGPVFDRKADQCDADKATKGSFCYWQFEKKMLDASGTRWCLERANEEWLQCLAEARQAQKDHDAGNEGNDIVANGTNQ